MAFCLSLGVHYTTLRGTTEWIGDAGNPHTNPINGLANSRFHTLLFGINRLRSDELPHCWAKSHCSGAIVQPRRREAYAAKCNLEVSRKSKLIDLVRDSYAPSAARSRSRLFVEVEPEQRFLRPL